MSFLKSHANKNLEIPPYLGKYWFFYPKYCIFTPMKPFKIAFIILIFALLSGLTQSTYSSADPNTPAVSDDARLAQVLDWVWRTMETEYYEPVSRAVYEDYVKTYTADRLKAINGQKKQTEDFIHLGAGLLVQKLKKPTDRFSTFVPPKKAVEFKQDAYAARADLGLEGRMAERGFELTRVQKHSQAFAEWLRPGDIVLAVDDRRLPGLDLETVQGLLRPEVGTSVRLNVFFSATGNTGDVVLTAGDYFAETVETPASGVEGVLILRIDHFNQKTGSDAAEAVNAYGVRNIRRIVIDLRENKGGPPLATREVLGMFTRPNDPLFIIARRGRQPVLLSSAMSETHYEGPITVLTSERTASAAETLAGVLREKLGARIVGQKTFGACYLKSMYDYTDGSTMLLVTSKTYFHNRRAVPEEGITPDVIVAAGQDSLAVALESIVPLRR